MQTSLTNPFYLCVDAGVVAILSCASDATTYGRLYSGIYPFAPRTVTCWPTIGAKFTLADGVTNASTLLLMSTIAHRGASGLRDTTVARRPLVST